VSNNFSSEFFSGCWIVDAGPGQVKTVATYVPIGDGKFAAVETVFNFDWTLNGTKPNARQASNLTGVVDTSGEMVSFVMVAYALDEHQRAAYILKAVGNKVLVDRDTISVQNLVFHIYEDPEACNPITDVANFTIPSTGTFPPVHEYRIK
jgi:hypothetical protein